MNDFKIHIGQRAIGGIPIGEAYIAMRFNDKFSMLPLKELKKWIDTIVESKGNTSEESYDAKNKLESFFAELFI